MDESSAAKIEREVLKLESVVHRYKRNIKSKSTQALRTTYVGNLDEELHQSRAFLDVILTENTLRYPTCDDGTKAGHGLDIDGCFHAFLAAFQNLLRLYRTEQVALHDR